MTDTHSADKPSSTRISELVRSREWRSLRFLCETLHPADLAEMMETLDCHESLDLLEELQRDDAIAVFEYLPVERQQEMVEGLNRRRMAPLINDMSPDDRADLVARLLPEVVEGLLPLLAAAERRDIKNLLQYKEDTAGSVMTTEYASLPVDTTVQEALARLRQQAPDRETIYDIYVLRPDRTLVGVLSLKDVILARPSAGVENIMNPNVISVGAAEDREEVAAKIRHYDFSAIPVVDDRDQLIGIVTVDDAMDVVDAEMTEDIYAIGAAGKPPEASYLDASVFCLARRRIIWLMLLVFTGLISGLVLQMFQGILERVIALTFFVPLLCGSGGNAGSQASTVVIRGLATGEVALKDFLPVLRKELAVGLLLGVALAVMAALRVMLLRSSTGDLAQFEFVLRLSVTVGLAMLGAIVIAKGLGASLPILFKRIGLDPALMSVPFITSILDILTLFIYLGLAKVIVIPFVS